MHSCLRHRALKLKPHAAVLKNMMTAMATYPTFLPLASGLAAAHKKGLTNQTPSAVYDTQHPTQAIARMNIFPRSDLFWLRWISLHLVLHSGFPRVFTISLLTPKDAGFCNTRHISEAAPEKPNPLIVIQVAGHLAAKKFTEPAACL